MNINDVLNQVDSPFTDEKIIELIKKFIECNFNFKEFYKNTNNMGKEEKENPYLKELYKFYVDPWERERGGRLFKTNDYWTIIGSNKDALDVPNKRDERVPIYRIYINVKGQDKAKTVEEYIKRCEEIGQTYKLKFANQDGRDDEIVILSYGEDLVRNIGFIEEITEGMKLGKPAELVGKYKGNIGIGEEYIQAPIYSYTEIRLGIIANIIKKIYIDHMDEIDSSINVIKEMLARTHKKNINEYYDSFSTYGSFFPKKDSEALKKYMYANFETLIPELLEDYHLLSKTFGISENGVFSIRTAEMIEQQRPPLLQQKEKELSTLEKETKKISEAEALIDKQKEGKYMGEE